MDRPDRVPGPAVASVLVVVAGEVVGGATVALVSPTLKVSSPRAAVTLLLTWKCGGVSGPGISSSRVRGTAGSEVQDGVSGLHCRTISRCPAGHGPRVFSK